MADTDSAAVLAAPVIGLAEANVAVPGLRLSVDAPPVVDPPLADPVLPQKLQTSPSEKVATYDWRTAFLQPCDSTLFHRLPGVPNPVSHSHFCKYCKDLRLLSLFHGPLRPVKGIEAWASRYDVHSGLDSGRPSRALPCPFASPSPSARRAVRPSRGSSLLYAD